MKKEYMKPQMKVYEVKCSKFLTASFDYSVNDGLPGDDNNEML